MKRILIISAAVLCTVLRAGAQAVVVDPSQIAASAVNVADQIDYAIDQIGELTDLGDKLGTLKGHIDNVFGEDGVGGKAIGFMQDLGTLDRLTKVFNTTLNTAGAYATQIKDSGKFRVSDANAMLTYLNTSKQTATMAVEVAKKILGSLGLSKGEKKAELDRTIKEMERSLKGMQTVMEIEVDASILAKGIEDFVSFVDNEGSTEAYTQALSGYGERHSTGSKALGLVSVILMLLGIVSCAYGYVIYTRGGIAGDPTAEKVFIRIGAAIFAASFLIGLISNAFNLNL